MARYVDGFLLPVPKKNLAAYVRMARKAGKGRHRDQVNRKVMADPRMNEMMDGKNMPFDLKRMSYGGFKSLVDLGA